MKSFGCKFLIISYQLGSSMGYWSIQVLRGYNTYFTSKLTSSFEVFILFISINKTPELIDFFLRPMQRHVEDIIVQTNFSSLFKCSILDGWEELNLPVSETRQNSSMLELMFSVLKRGSDSICPTSSKGSEQTKRVMPRTFG